MFEALEERNAAEHLWYGCRPPDDCSRGFSCRKSRTERISAGHGSAWRITYEQAEAYNAIAYPARRDLSLAQIRWELQTSRARLLDAIAAATPHGLDPSRYSETGLRSDHEAEHTGWIKRWRGERGF